MNGEINIVNNKFFTNMNNTFHLPDMKWAVKK